MRKFTVQNKKITVYPAVSADSPIIYLHTYSEEGEDVYRELKEKNCPDFTLAAICGLDWDRDMSPWDIPPISKNNTPCTGGADEYLHLLEEEIMPRVEKEISGKALWRGIAGYSLGGLFAIYSLYCSDVFSRAASISGSLWFPDFKEYVFSHEMKTTPRCLYFSLGNKECKTRNPYMKTVQDNTEKIEAFYQGKGIDTTFELNPGNHFKDPVKRTAAGIAWILNR